LILALDPVHCFPARRGRALIARSMVEQS